MKKFLFLLTITLVITSCSITKKPEFKYIDNLEIKNMGMRNVTLKADAVFNNPNHVKGTLSIDSISVFIDDIEAGIISSESFDVPSKNEFTIPLQGTFSLSKIYKKNASGILGSVLKAIQTDSLQIRYKGNIRYHLGSFSYPYAIDKTQKVPIK